MQVMPGDNVEMIGDLVHDVALEQGSRYVFCIFEGTTALTG